MCRFHEDWRVKIRRTPSLPGRAHQGYQYVDTTLQHPVELSKSFNDESIPLWNYADAVVDGWSAFC